MPGCYAYFRLPNEKEYTLLISERDAEVLTGGEDDISGFVIAPFSCSEAAPALLIKPGTVSRHEVPEGEAEISEVQEESLTEAYAGDFSVFHKAVIDGRFSKLVLSRRKEISLKCNSAETLFLNACRTYPALMVILFHTDISGTWLITTPETLIRSESDGRFTTVALAGTMPIEEKRKEWSKKNKEEQHFVQTFILDTISKHCSDTAVTGPYTVPAGELLHLRTDISFSTKANPLTIAKALHPTPAVCGIPKDEAKMFILTNEHNEREYYSGYSGPVNMDGTTALFVSLRCAKLIPEENKAVLYAGGGIMPESQCASEFNETCNKMKTIERCIVTG